MRLREAAGLHQGARLVRRAVVCALALSRAAPRAGTPARLIPRVQWCFGITAEEEMLDLLGVVKLRCQTEKRATVSYVLREDTWGRGYATRAVAKVLTFAFTTLALDTVTAQPHPDNPASGRVLAKNGFTRTGFSDGFVTYAIHRRGSVPRGSSPP